MAQQQSGNTFWETHEAFTPQEAERALAVLRSREKPDNNHSFTEATSPAGHSCIGLKPKPIRYTRRGPVCWIHSRWCGYCSGWGWCVRC